MLDHRNTFLFNILMKSLNMDINYGGLMCCMSQSSKQDSKFIYYVHTVQFRELNMAFCHISVFPLSQDSKESKELFKF